MFEPNSTGKCPHCRISNRFEYVNQRLLNQSPRNASRQSLIYGVDNNRENDLVISKCTNCGDIVIQWKYQMIYPLGSVRQKAPQELPSNIAKDFNEACLVEPLSKKASAALGRRCLQNMLHDQGIKDRDLSKEIDQAIQQLPSYLGEAIDAIRNIGNFAAHPIKTTNTGDILEVEEGETEWTLDVLEQLFDFYYVQPSITQAKKAALNAKLASADKPSIK